jgi:hypothetical protein
MHQASLGILALVDPAARFEMTADARDPGDTVSAGIDGLGGGCFRGDAAHQRREQ